MITPTSTLPFMDRREEFLSKRRMVFFVHISGWSPNAIDQWKGPYQTPSTAQAAATKMTRYSDGLSYGDWTATIYRLGPDTLTLVDVNRPTQNFSGFGGDPIDKELIKAVVKERKEHQRCRCGDFASPNGTCNWGNSGCYNCPA